MNNKEHSWKGVEKLRWMHTIAHSLVNIECHSFIYCSATEVKTKLGNAHNLWSSVYPLALSLGLVEICVLMQEKVCPCIYMCGSSTDILLNTANADTDLSSAATTFV